MKHWEKVIGILLACIAVVFGAWLYRLEPTALVDPNDNAFQFALVNRTNDVWDWAYNQRCPRVPVVREACVVPWLLDHWVPNWAEGYNLPTYYSHVPQIAVVTVWRVLQLVVPVSLFTVYHWIIYLLLILFPVSVFLALRMLGLSWITAGIGALLAPLLSTDGLYGLDATSYLWRGWGLSSQLFAMPFLPPALAAAANYLTAPPDEPAKRLRIPKNLAVAAFWLTATTAGHLGIGIMAFMAIPAIAISPAVMAVLHGNTIKSVRPLVVTAIYRSVLLALIPIALLSYWIVPVVLGDNYHNTSWWDPVWKFNSYGIQETLVRLWNGALFDFGRLPILTAAVGIGLFAAMLSESPAVASLSVAFLFYLVIYFGRTTWGSLIDLVPGMKDFHISRFLVGIHAAALILIPLGIRQLAVWTTDIATVIYNKKKSNISKSLIPVFSLAIALVAGLFAVPQIVRYASFNDTLILRANENERKVHADTQALLAKLSSLPRGRVYAGRGGNWGKSFRVAETPMYIYLSTYGAETVLWLPETWSPNSDTEQYFSEDDPNHYALYDIRYVVTPPDIKPQQFWNKLDQGQTWILYSVEQPAGTGRLVAGTMPTWVVSKKEHIVNPVRLWIQSQYHAKGVFPQLLFSKPIGLIDLRPHFTMTDEADYRTPDGQRHSLFAEVPVYPLPDIAATVSGVRQDPSGMTFAAEVTVGNPCQNCILVLKNTFHPTWKAWVDGEPVTPVAIFPFYIGIPLKTPGIHAVTVAYVPSPFKMLLLTLAIAGLAVTVFLKLKKRI